mgnify:CR=1 FL=1|jgi:flagellin-like hook-associated protein FlgL
MSDVTLSAAVRNTLLSLQNTTDLINRTNNRLSSGLRVSSPVDDPVAFFSAKALNDRTFTFTERKDGIDQGISTVTAALDGVEGIDSLVRQLKGIANSLKSATGVQFTDLVTQFNGIRSQIGDLANDADYQGLNLIDNTSQSLSVNFADNTSSLLTINATNLRQSGLSIDQAEIRTDSKLSFAATTGAALNTTGSVTGGVTSFSAVDNAQLSVTFNGTGERVFSTTGGNSLTLSFGTATFTIRAATNANVTISQGAVITLSVVTTFQASDLHTTGAATGFSLSLGANQLLAVFTGGTILGTGASSQTLSLIDASGGFQETDFLAEGAIADLDNIVVDLDGALATLRTESQKLGSNVALLQTRLDFTEAYINTLDEGAGKLTLADLNAEGANLLALQTRQQLGISALSFAGQSEQGILALFN